MPTAGGRGLTRRSTTGPPTAGCLGPGCRYAVHFRQPGPSHPAVGGRLAPTLCRTKCVHAGSASLHVATSAHGKRDLVAGRGNRESRGAKSKRVCVPHEKEERSSGSQYSTYNTLRGSSFSISHSSHRATQDMSASQRASSNPRRCRSSRLARRAAAPWRSPQRRSTAPALPSAETGMLLWPATSNQRVSFAGKCGRGITPR